MTQSDLLDQMRDIVSKVERHTTNLRYDIDRLNKENYKLEKNERYIVQHVSNDSITGLPHAVNMTGMGFACKHGVIMHHSIDDAIAWVDSRTVEPVGAWCICNTLNDFQVARGTDKSGETVYRIIRIVTN